MTAGQVIVWMVVGLIAGWLASMVAGRGLGIVGDIVLGIVGAFLGGLLFRALGWRAPFGGGLAGVITVAFIGAVVLLLALRLIRRGTSPSH